MRPVKFSSEQRNTKLKYETIPSTVSLPVAVVVRFVFFILSRVMFSALFSSI